MENEFSYIVNDAICLCAIEELEGGMDTLQWLGEHLELYMNVTYSPAGRPRIANCNFEGRYYNGISAFAALYIKTHHEHDDPFTDPSEGRED